jgi:hypothetical protein
MAHIPAKIKSTYYFPRPSPFPQLQYVGYILLVLAIVQGWERGICAGWFFHFSWPGYFAAQVLVQAGC